MAESYDINIDQFATFEMTLTFTDGSGSYLDISDWSLSASIKEGTGIGTEIAYFTFTTLSLPSASVSMWLPPVSTSLLQRSKYYYDVIRRDTTVNPPVVIRLLKGKVVVSAGVTES